MSNRNRPNRSVILIGLAVACVAWPLAAFLWLSSRDAALAVSIFGLGLSLGPCLAAYGYARRARKQTMRRLVLLTGGLSIMAMSLLGAMSLDLEAFFMLVLSGTAGAAVGHTMVTVIVGPVLFGRVLCGWGCWRGMILELLPIGQGRGRLGGKWRLLPFAGLAVSIGAAVSLLAIGHHPGGVPPDLHGESILPIIVGFAVYYVASIGLAFPLKDQRAFCKYLCPSSVILRRTSRLSLAKMAANADLCNGCGACSRVCPMDIDVVEYATRGRRITSGECILCQRCAHTCPTDALRLSLGLDVGGATTFVSARSE